MKISILLATLLSIPLSLTAAKNLTTTPRSLARSEETCGDPADSLPFYRIYAASFPLHFYSFDVTDLSAAILSRGYTLQTVAGMVFATQEESTVPFYHLILKSVHLWTISTAERDTAIQEGYVLETVDQSYIYPTQICGSVPFYHLSTQTDNFYTTSESERLAFITTEEYTDMGIAGYVLPLPCTQCS
ncbi:hypothetical protein K438DRAFT_1937611 [Mycena galopus ATCC 62051]|nr:hypothetical protein K438DRAFT_1937611 [Mycena galopus ATCC 62051]